MNLPGGSIRTIFADALEIRDREARAAFVCQACGADSVLRDQNGFVGIPDG